MKVSKGRQDGDKDEKSEERPIWPMPLSYLVVYASSCATFIPAIVFRVVDDMATLGRDSRPPGLRYPRVLYIPELLQALTIALYSANTSEMFVMIKAIRMIPRKHGLISRRLANLGGILFRSGSFSLETIIVCGVLWSESS